MTVGAAPLLSSRWLVPRLADFWSRYPDIDLWIHHSPQPVWQQLDKYDLAIAWGNGEWSGVNAVPLLDVVVTPVLSASLAQEISLRNPADILNLPLLQHRDSAEWVQWFQSVGVNINGYLAGTVFEDANILLQAALSGRGIALGVLPLVEDDINAGKLIAPFCQKITPKDAYYLVRSNSQPQNEAVDATWNWLLQK